MSPDVAAGDVVRVYLGAYRLVRVVSVGPKWARLQTARRRVQRFPASVLERAQALPREEATRFRP